jgi:hypothetical protein
METTGPNAGGQLNGEAISKHLREIPSNWRLGPVGRLVRAALHSMKPPATNTRTRLLKLWKENTPPPGCQRDGFRDNSKLVGRTQHSEMYWIWKVEPRVPQRSNIKTESWWAISKSLNAFHPTENIPNDGGKRTSRDAAGSACGTG